MAPGQHLFLLIVGPWSDQAGLGVGDQLTEMPSFFSLQSMERSFMGFLFYIQTRVGLKSQGRGRGNLEVKAEGTAIFESLRTSCANPWLMVGSPPLIIASIHWGEQS